MTKKAQTLLRCLALITGLTLGIVASYLMWTAKEYFTNPDQNISRLDTDKLEKSHFWEKATVYFEEETSLFLDSYINIYSSFDLCSVIDDKLIPYYEKYGYTAMLSSGLKSDNKLANIYCIEKCCELYGENLFDNKTLLSALKNVKIDKALYTDNEDEGSYIHIAQERLNLAKALLDESYSSDKIIKNSDKSRMAWISNLMDLNKSLRIYDYGSFYTTSNTFDSLSSIALKFETDDIIISNDGSNYILISIRNSVTEYNINQIIDENISKAYSSLHIKAIDVSDDSFSVTFNTTTSDNDKDNVNKYKLTYNMTSNTATVN